MQIIDAFSIFRKFNATIIVLHSNEIDANKCILHLIALKWLNYHGNAREIIWVQRYVQLNCNKIGATRVHLALICMQR